MKKQIIRNQAEKIESLANSVMTDYKAEGYEVQKLEVKTSDNKCESLLVQIRNTSSGVGSWFKKAIGCETCASLILTPLGNDLEIKVSGGKWLDKAAVVGVSMVVLWPLFFTAAIGTFRQKALLNNLFMSAINKLASDEV